MTKRGQVRPRKPTDSNCLIGIGDGALPTSTTGIKDDHALDLIAVGIGVAEFFAAEDAQKFSHGTFIAGFFSDLTPHGFFRSFARFNGSSGQTPRAVVRTPHEKTPLFIMDHGGDAGNEQEGMANRLSQVFVIGRNNLP